MFQAPVLSSPLFRAPGAGPAGRGGRRRACKGRALPVQQAAHPNTARPGPSEANALKCGYCGNDLMLGIVPKGPARLLRLLPMAAYRCVRCGGLNWRMSDSYGAVGSRLAMLVLGLAALGLAYWLGAVYGLPGQDVHAVRREVAMAPQEPPRQALPQPAAVTGQHAPPAPVEDAPARPVAAPQPAPSAAPTLPAPPQTAAQAEPSAPAPADSPAPAPAPAPAKTDGGLEEVVVAPPAPAPSRPEVVAANRAASGASSKWALSLRDVGVRSAGGTATVTVRANASLDTPRAFVLASPPRYVLDLPGTWSQDSLRELKAKGGIVKGVRTGRRDQALRLVLDLTRAPAAEPVVAVQGDTVTITLR